MLASLDGKLAKLVQSWLLWGEGSPQEGEFPMPHSLLLIVTDLTIDDPVELLGDDN